MMAIGRSEGLSPRVAVVGGGPAGLMAAEVAAAGGAQVVVYDRMPSVGRKFLLAGRGGLNITHSEDLEAFKIRYGAAATRIGPALAGFTPGDMRNWCDGLGQPCFVGSSGRVFPNSFKTSPLLRAWLKRLAALGVTVRSRHRWTGWGDNGTLLFETPDGPVAAQAHATVLALGGASWPQLGSDGAWAPALTEAGVDVAPLRPANCGFTVEWSTIFKDRFEGEPLKNVSVMFDGRVARGDVTITRAGVEGGPIYALSSPLRDALDRTGEALVHVALRPDLAEPDIERRLGVRAHKQSLSNHLRKALKLSPAACGLLHEAALGTGEALGGMAVSRLAALVKAVPVRLTGTMPLTRAISTAGGVVLDEVDASSMLRGRAGTFVAGEMLDWEAPTGGYLLQASFSTGVVAGHGALAWAKAHSDDGSGEVVEHRIDGHPLGGG